MGGEGGERDAGAGAGGSTRAPGTYCPMNEPSSVKRPFKFSIKIVARA